MHAVQVRDVDTALVRSRVILVVLVEVKGEEDDINTVDVLEHNDALASKRELIRVLLVFIPLLHQLADFKLTIHGRDLTNDDRSIGLDLSLYFLLAQVLCKC